MIQNLLFGLVELRATKRQSEPKSQLARKEIGKRRGDKDDKPKSQLALSKALADMFAAADYLVGADPY